MLEYIIKLSISLTIVYLFYQLLLRRLTFYNWNRWYLLIYSLVCFVIPFINVFTIIIERPALRQSAFINYIPAITQLKLNEARAANGIHWLQIGIIVFVSGMLFMIVRLLLQYYSLYRMRSKAVLLYDENVKLYHINEPVMPFSFGRGIYVNQHQHSLHELQDIIRHEFIHVKQRHSLDILWSELLCILNWYNPFAWLLRHDIRQNLEFIADHQVLQTGLDRKQYQYLLLKVIGVNSFSIATNFNFSSLKRRIAMMNKTQSARVHLMRFLFLLPLLVVVLLAFRNTNEERRQSQPVKEVTTDTVPTAVKEPAGAKEVATIDIAGNRRVIVRLKSGKVEKYDLQVPEQREAFTAKYGPVPEPPTPPAAPTVIHFDREVRVPEAPEKPEKVEIREIPEAVEFKAGVEAPEPPEAPEAPEKPTINLQDCLNKKGYCLTIADNFGECIVIVKDKNNKIVQAIFLTDWNTDKQYEEKYGEIPATKPRRTLKIVHGRPLTLTNLQKVEGKNAQPDVVIGETVPTKASVGLSADVVAVPNATRSIRPQTNEVVVLGVKGEPRVATRYRLASKKADRVTFKVDEVMVIGLKSEARAAMDAKPAAAPKARAAKSVKPAPGQPSQEQ